MKNDARKFVTHQAWVEGKWARDVVLSVAADGTWASVLPNASAAQQRDATRVPGAVLPGVVNGHSHAFQRAMAGFTERRRMPVASTPAALREAAPADDFWYWRERMYSAANRIGPEQLEAVATQLYGEMLIGGYTQVCEFHYLHHAPDGRPYADPLEMAQALVRAAQRVGLGLTLLPTLYMRAGFGESGLRDEQRRFASTPDSVLRAVEAINRQSATAARASTATSPAAMVDPSLVTAGVALHSLRAVDPAALLEVAASARRIGLPVHIHIAEQLREVEDCVAHHGQRPIEWLLAHAGVDARWNLVHATHATPAELQGIRNANAAIVVCPSTEANLGDGVFDLPGFARVGGLWSIGSDSHVTRSWPEELRLLEYAHRLKQRQRNIAALSAGRESSAAALLEAVVAGGRAASGQRAGPIQVGRRADFLVLDEGSPALLGLPPDHQLDALVFSSPTARFAEVFVAGQRVVKDGQVVGPRGESGLWPDIGAAFVPAMQALWRSGGSAGPGGAA